MRQAFLTPLVLVAGFAVLPAHAQVSEDRGTDVPLPRFQEPAPPGSPGKADCKRKACVFLVNVSGHQVTELRYAVGKSADGQPQWSNNQFDPRFAFYSKHWTAWFKPKDLGCTFALKIVMDIDGKKIEQSGQFDTCANPTLLFYIHDPRAPRGYVIVEPEPTESVTSPKP